LGYGIADRPVHVNDFNATLLHLLGLDHEKLTYRSLGLDQRLTGVEEHHVVREVVA
jgi:arylsulfatase A-like enzyme